MGQNTSQNADIGLNAIEYDALGEDQESEND